MVRTKISRNQTATTPRLFGTDGIRGVANSEPMTAETVQRLGRALAHRCREQNPRPRILIGRDTRLSGDMLEAALTSGLTSMGADVVLAGVIPTPAVAYLARTLPADAGAVVSASHNPFRDNGIKFFGGDGFKLADGDERAIEDRVFHPVEALRPSAGDVGRIAHLDDAAARYEERLCSLLPVGVRLDRLRIVVDAAHGAAYQVAPAVFSALGAEVLAIGVEPDGRNINDGCGALHPELVQAAVRNAHADVGVALDGDADRVILVDDRGEVVDGDEMLAMLACDMIAHGTLRGSTVVATVMSNLGLEMALRERGVQLERAAVGDRHVVEAMRHGGYNLGGEQSGHLILLDHSTTGDGLVAALLVASLIVTQGQRLSDLKRVMTKLPQVLLNVRVGRRDELDSVAPVRQTIDRVRAALHDRGRVLVRYSGTEPLVRVMVEGENVGQVNTYAQEIVAVIQKSIGV